MANAIRPDVKAYLSARHFRESSLSLAINLLILLASQVTAAARMQTFQGLLPTPRPIITGTGSSYQVDVRALEPGKPIERELAGGEAHTYRFTLGAGQYARIEVAQRHINISLS